MTKTLMTIALKAAEDYGFKHFTEIEFEDNGNIEIVGEKRGG